MKKLLFFILLISDLGFSKIQVMTAYSSRSLSSDVISGASFSGLDVSANYLLVPKLFGPTAGKIGLTGSFNKVSWINGFFERVGFINEVGLDLIVDYPSKSFPAYGGFRIPLYSKALIGGTLSTLTTQGVLESNSETHYSGSGFDVFLGGAYPVGKLKLFSLGLETFLGLELAYISRTYALVETNVISTFSDFSGPHNYQIGMSGIGFKLAVNFNIK